MKFPAIYTQIRCLTFLFSLLLSWSPLFAQDKPRFLVQVSKDRLEPGDTLLLTAEYTIGDRELPLATLDVVLKQEPGTAQWRMRWPIIEKIAQSAIVIPPNFPAGIYRLYFAVQPRFYRVYGRILSPWPNQNIDGVFIDHKGKRHPVMFPVNRGQFEWIDFYFENEGQLVFDESSFKKGTPPIAIETWLDSAYTPVAFNAKAISIGQAFKTEPLGELNTTDARTRGLPFYEMKDRYKTLSAQFPQWTAQQYFDSLFVSESFKTEGVLVYDCLNNPKWNESEDLESFLQKMEPGFRLNRWTRSATPSAIIQKADYLFYVDEQPADMMAMARLTRHDLAQIRIFRPGNPDNKKSTGRIALYTRRSPFLYQDPYYHNWRLKGYQPPVYSLPVKPDANY